MKILLALFLFSISIYAKGSISIDEILKENFTQDIKVEKKSLILTKEEAKHIQQDAETRLASKIIRLYHVIQGDTIIGYGVLIKKRIRTKNAAVLYMIDSDKKIKGIEILSFSEPLEYKPNKTWQKVFEGKSGDDMLISGKDIPTISGATMSADALSKAARLALSIIKIKRP